MNDNKIIKLEGISKEFNTKYKSVQALSNVSIDFESGKFYAIMGHSGSGKSTLINILGLLETPTKGIYKINGVDTKNIDSDMEADLRRDFIGMIFQDFFLDEHLKAYENVILPMLINKNIETKERKNKSLELLRLVDLEDRATHYPRELSGGEKQRVSIARALANDSKVILADEPTGNLDEENEQKIFSILKKLSESGKCIIVVSHSNEIKKYADVIYRLDKGKLVEE